MVEPTLPSPDRRPLLIVVSSLSASSREPFFQSVAPYYRIWLFVGGAGRPDEASWELPYVLGHTVVDTLDADAVLVAARQVAREHQIAGTAVAGIVCYDEARIEATAMVAEALGLPTSPAAAVTRCRDKWLTRQALDAAGVPQAGSVAVRSLAEAQAAAERFGYPVVVKPRNLAASFGVTRVDSPAELPEPYARARDTTLPEAPLMAEDHVLVEEYIDGPEISVDCACFDGQVVPVTIARKETGFPPSFEETGHVVDAADPLLAPDSLLAAELRDVLVRAHAAVGFHTGITHVELRCTATGFKIIEINARLGGDMIPYLGQLATGVDLSLAAAAIACGRTPDLTRRLHRVAAIRFGYPERDLTLASVAIETNLLPAEIERAVLLAQPGQRMLLPPRGSAWECRLAQMVAVADSVPACQAALDAAAKALIVVPADPDHEPAAPA